MDRQSVKSLMRQLVGPGVVLADHDGWVGLPCVLARWEHEKGVDLNPSAGVSVKEGGDSIYNCFVCGKKSLPTLIKTYARRTGTNLDGLVDQIEDIETFGAMLPEWGSRVHEDEDVTPPEVIPDAGLYLSLYETCYHSPYLAGRGVYSKTAELCDIRQDVDREGDHRVLFPVYTPEGGLLGFTGRATHDSVLKVRDYHGLPKRKALLGSHLRPEGADRVVVVEGLIDVAKVTQAGYYAVAVMHSGLTAYQARLLLQIGLPVVSFRDDDLAGRNGTATDIRRLGGYLPLSVVQYTEELRECGVKDPGHIEMREDDIVRLVESSEPI